MKQELEERRKKLMNLLELLVESASDINQEMNNAPHQRGVCRISLKPRSGMYLVAGADGFTGEYQSKDGEWYRISIHKNKGTD